MISTDDLGKAQQFRLGSVTGHDTSQKHKIVVHLAHQACKKRQMK